MSGPAELNFNPPTSAVRNTVGKDKEQTSTKPDRPASDAALQEYCDKHYHQLLPIIAEKVHNEKVQQEKLKEVKARLIFKGEIGPRHLGTGRKIKGEGKEMCCRLGIEGEVCPHTQKAATKIPIHEEQSRSQKVKIVEGDIGNQSRKNRSQISKRKIYLNHGHARRQIVGSLENLPSSCKSRALGNADMVPHDQFYTQGCRPGFDSNDLPLVTFQTTLRGRSLMTCAMQRSDRRRDKFTLLTKSPKEILAIDKGKFKTPPPMTTPVEKRYSNKFCEFHREVGHNTDECMHLKRQTEEMIKAGKLTHLIKGLKQGGKDQTKTTKKGETSRKYKAMAILMVQPWQKVARQKITQSFSLDPEISFPPLGEEDGMEGPMIIEAEIEGLFIHRMYVDGGSSSEILYEHCFKRIRPKVKNQMVPATTPLIGFSGEVIRPMGQILLPVKIREAKHSTSA
ncbi:hypothetical protein Tco_0985832 [Tanacetum coccineum]